MKISNLTLENFKCYKTATQAEFAPITLIYGENGGGKSTLLQALEVMKHTAADTSKKQHEKLIKKISSKSPSDLMSIRMRDRDFMDWELTCSESVLLAGAADCRFIEEQIYSIARIIQEDLPVISNDIMNYFEHNIKVLTLIDALNADIKSSSATYKKYDDIIKSQFSVSHEHGDVFYNFDTQKAFREENHLFAFEKGAVSSFIEQQNLISNGDDKADFYKYIKELISQSNFSERFLKQIGYTQNMNSHQLKVVYANMIELILDIYRFSSEMKVYIWIDRNWDDGIGFDYVFGFQYVFQGKTERMLGLRISKCLFFKYQYDLLFEAQFRGALKDYLDLSLSQSVRDYFMGLYFVEQPRGYDCILSGKLNAKLKRNLIPLLALMFPDIEFDVRTDGEKQDIYIYDDVLDAEVPALECGFGYSQVLPILMALADTEHAVVCVSEPESHVHPKLQAGIGSLFLKVAKESGKQIIAETHSEHIVLRIQRLIRCGEMTPDMVSVLYVSKTPEGSTVKRLHLDEKGRFIDAWPNGFFAERDEELFGGKPE